MVLVRIQNPFKNEYVVVNMPQDMKLADMQQVSELACKMANDISGSSEIPKSFTTFPVTTVGKRALLLVAQTMPDELANAQEGQLLISMLSAVNFLDQLLDRVGKKVMMRKSEYKNSIIEYCTKSPPEFVDAVRARALHLVDQARHVVPADEARANRLATLVDIVLQTFSELEEQSSDAEEKQFGGSEEPLEGDLEKEPTDGELEEEPSEYKLEESSNEEEEQKPKRLSDEEAKPKVFKEKPIKDKKEQVKEKNPAPQKKEEQVDEEEDDEEMMSDEDEDPEFSDAEFVSDEDEMEDDDEEDDS